MYELPRKNIYQRLNHHIKTGIIIGNYSSSPKWSTLPSPARHWLQERKWGEYAEYTTFLIPFFECDTAIFYDIAPLDTTQDVINKIADINVN